MKRLAGGRAPDRRLDHARAEVPPRNALLADLTEPAAYGRAYGFERAMDNLGAIAGPLLALLLVVLVGARGAMLLSVVPGLLAAGAILYAIRQIPRSKTRPRQPLRLQPGARRSSRTSSSTPQTRAEATSTTSRSR